MALCKGQVNYSIMKTVVVFPVLCFFGILRPSNNTTLSEVSFGKSRGILNVVVQLRPLNVWVFLISMVVRAFHFYMFCCCVLLVAFYCVGFFPAEGFFSYR